MAATDEGDERRRCWGGPSERRLIRRWLRGSSSKAPEWVLVLQAAEEWGTPPWSIEEHATALWWERWVAWKKEKAAWEKKQGSKGDWGDEVGDA